VLSRERERERESNAWTIDYTCVSVDDILPFVRKDNLPKGKPR